jgi:GntR family transcriptional regulator/MocR family aminotransferase
VDVRIDLGLRTDLSGEIYRQLRRAVLDGSLKPGAKLPPSRALAADLAVSRATVVGAYERLSAEGYFVSRAGSGTFVSDDIGLAGMWPRRVPPSVPSVQGSHGTPSDAPSGAPPGASNGAALRPRAVWSDVQVPAAGRAPDYDFRPGIPDAAMFPYDVWRRLVGRELHAGDGSAGAYGDPGGHAGLRSAIAGHVKQSRGLDVSADDITITNGTQQAVDLIARVLVDPGDQVAIEEPGYQPPRRLFATLGARVVSVPVDDEGLVVEALPARTRLVYTSPSHQFPLGAAMSLRRRIGLLEWAQVHDAAIIEDDYDSELAFDANPVEPLRTLDGYGRVLYVGSFSKTMLNTLRLGFVVAPSSLRQALRAAKFVTDWHTALPVQAALARFIEEGWYARHVRRMRAVYQERHQQVVESLRRDFAGLLQVVDGPGGLHVAAIASPDVDVGAAVRDAADAGVGVHSLARYSTSDSAPAGLVIGYGAIGADRIAEGLRRLRSTL